MSQPEPEQAAREDPDWQAAMRRRGITDFSLCMLDLWPAGNFGTDKPGQRLSRALTWVRAHPGDNGYAHRRCTASVRCDSRIGR